MSNSNTPAVDHKQTVRFTASGNNLDVLKRDGKTGISVFVRTREAGKRAVIGCRNVFLPANASQAQAKFDALVKDAEAKGWTRRAATGAAGSKFTEIPAPNAMPASAPLKAKAESKPNGGKPAVVPNKPAAVAARR